MFILICERDNSYCKIDDSEVMFDKNNPPTEGESVVFFYNKKKETGRVIMFSDKTKAINIRFEELKKNSKKRKIRDSSSEEKDDSSIVASKRMRKVNTKYSTPSFENLDFLKEPKKRHEKRDVKDVTKKKGEKILQSVIEKTILTKKDEKSIISEKQASTSSEEVLKRQLREAHEKQEHMKHLFNSVKAKEQSRNIHPSTSTTNSWKKNQRSSDGSKTASDVDSSTDKENIEDWIDTSGNNEDSFDKTEEKLKNYDVDEMKKSPRNSTDKNNENSPIIDRADDTELNDPDLYGKDWPKEKMVKLIDRVYCKDSELSLTKSISSQASHVARRLITGVFKPSGYLTSTFTGQAARAHKKLENPATAVKPLNEVARKEIIDYALQLARVKNWTMNGMPQTEKYIERAMSQKIGELKREHAETLKKVTQ